MTTLDRLEQYRRRYAALKPDWEPSTACYQRWVAERLSLETRVLDLGCGRGGIVERLHTQGEWTGIDPDMLSLKEHRLSQLPRSHAYAGRLPFAGDTFDIVVSSWVMEHAEHPAELFKEVARILRPAGRFFVLTPNAHHPIPGISRLLARLVHIQQRIVPKIYGRAGKDAFPIYYRANTPDQLDACAQRAGLQRVRLALIEDPSYFAWNSLTFWCAIRLERLLPVDRKVHLVVEYKRPF